MTIAEAAARCGLPESTLRYWERIGLVDRVQREAGIAGVVASEHDVLDGIAWSLVAPS